MGIVVQKYGGSSVADVEKIKRVADRITATRARGQQVVVVVSAMGGTTDQLIDLARQVDRNDRKASLEERNQVTETVCRCGRAVNEQQ